MPDQSVIVWDLETVPDLGGFAAANDLVGAFADFSQRLPVDRDKKSGLANLDR